MKCNKCGNINPNLSKFCGKCGNKIEILEKNTEYSKLENYGVLRWYQTEKGNALIFLGILFLLTSWYTLFLAFFMLPIIFYVKKGNKIAIILAGLYSMFLTIVNISVYITKNTENRTIQSGFNLKPVYFCLGILVFIFIFLIKAYKEEKSKNKSS